MIRIFQLAVEGKNVFHRQGKYCNHPTALYQLEKYETDCHILRVFTSYMRALMSDYCLGQKIPRWHQSM